MKLSLSGDSRLGRLFAKSSAKGPPESSVSREELYAPQQWGVLCIKGLITADLEGPWVYDDLPKIIKRIGCYIIRKIYTSNPLTEGGLAFIYEHVVNGLLKNSPYATSRRHETFPRLTIALPLSGFSSSTCVPYPLISPSLEVTDLWEFRGNAHFPLIVSCALDLQVSSELIHKRDKLRMEGLSPLPLPSPKSLTRTRETIEHIKSGEAFYPTASSTALAVPNAPATPRT